ncbi:hypothetical protein M2428_003456 [Arthrobacter sp. ES3-54]|nr:hypothetical protein [Arthrobacter sp. ES3-54]
MVHGGADMFILGLSWGTLNYWVRPYVIQGQNKKSRGGGKCRWMKTSWLRFTATMGRP